MLILIIFGVFVGVGLGLYQGGIKPHGVAIVAVATACIVYYSWGILNQLFGG